MTDDVSVTNNRFRRILVATDGSAGATLALRSAVDLTALMRAELVVLNVFESPEVSAIRDPQTREFARAEHLHGDYAEAKEIMSENILGDAKEIVGQHPGVQASYVFLEGDPSAEILRYADEIAADLIVMGSRGRGRLVGLLLGSVSQNVTAATRHFVLIAPASK